MKFLLAFTILPIINVFAGEHLLLNTSAGPIVDLGYGLWQATVNETGQYYNFSNIRFAQPPVGELRFAAPQPPLVNRTTINNGQDRRVCPQSSPQWSTERSLFTSAYFNGNGNISSFENVPPPGENGTTSSPMNSSEGTEDCLFLDVIVPQSIYDAGSCNNTSGAPVLAWIFGGGFYEGSKVSQGDPAGIIAQSLSNSTSSPGIVYVAINYRLGALGWLAGSTFEASGGLPNAGFYDQRLALQWIQKYIQLFGGNPARVTAMGASAGASSVMHQITAFGGAEGDAPFQQAVLQSPAFDPNPYNFLQEEEYQRFLEAANATSLIDLRAASTSNIIAANALVIFNSTGYGATGYGPVVDGAFVPALPSLLLSQGRRAQNVKAIFSGHNLDEGFLFTNPAIQNTSAFNGYLMSTALPDAQPTILDYVENTLYPVPAGNLSGLGYNDTITRLATLRSDFNIACNTFYLLKAFDVNKSYAYLFDEGLSLHGEETPYTFYNYGPTKDVYGFGLVNGTVAQTLQDWFINFVATGNPNSPGVAPIPTYGVNRTMGLLSNKGLGINATDPAGLKRCEFWEEALYF